MKLFKKYREKEGFFPAYRVIAINKNNNDEYIATIQLINKSNQFEIKPEEILKNDRFVSLFSPYDIRTLTYLGYLSINSPQYQILAQRLSEKNDKTLFAIKKRGEKEILIKTAAEILKEKEISENLNAKDSHIVGYTVGTESILKENKIRKNI